MVVYQGPGIGLEFLEAERDPFSLPVQVEHVNVYLLTDLEHLVGIVYPAPTDFRNVDQAVSPAQVYESTETGDVGHSPMPRLPFRQLGHNPLALQFLPGAQCPPLGKNQAAATAVYFDDLETKLLPDHVCQASAALFLWQAPGQPYDLRSGDKAANLAKLNHEATTIVAGDLALVEFAFVHYLLSPEPVLVQAGLVDGQYRMPISVFGLDHQH